MAVVITQTAGETAGPMPLPPRWAVIEGETITDVTGQSFMIDGQEYPQSLFFYPNEQRLKEIGLYKVIDNFPKIGIFERLIGGRYSTVDHDLKEIIKEYDVIRFTDQEISDSINVMVQMHLNAFAMTKGYESMLSACTYINSAVDQFRKDAEYCVQIRDETWQAAFSVLASVLSGDIPMPNSTMDIMVMLPKGQWPAQE
jgi:hypothetical protein